MLKYHAHRRLTFGLNEHLFHNKYQEREGELDINLLSI